MVIEYLKKNDCYTEEILENIMSNRLVHLQDENFRSQYDLIIKEIEKDNKKVVDLNNYR